MNKKFQALNKSVLHQIESVLRDKKRLVDRTRTKRTEYPVIGEKKDTNTYDEEIFDDLDYYQEMLKELIDGGVSGSDIHQRNFKRAAKKQKQTRKKYTKDKSLRYDVKQEIQNFMAPALAPQCPWNLDDLYSNLFSGRTK